MTEYVFDIKLPSNVYTIEIDSEALYGYFDHNVLGDEKGGGLWFERVSTGLELIDYDGMSYLPKLVRLALIEQGIVVDAVFE